MGISIMSVDANNRKHCEFCKLGFADGDIIIDYVSSSFRGHSNFRWAHLSCVLANANALLSPKCYNKIYDDFLIRQV